MTDSRGVRMKGDPYTHRAGASGTRRADVATIRRMIEPVTCELCGRSVDVHASYVVRIEVFADPTMPPMSTEEIESTDFDRTLDDLLEQMKSMTADDLQNSVHRRFEHRLCPACHRRFLANPLGKPRTARTGTN